MAKQRRARPRPVRPKPADPAFSTDASGIAGRDRLPHGAPPAAPIPRPGHLEAVALYEEGVAALQAHEYSRASALLRSVVTRYPDERELHERVRLYLNVCERHMTPLAASPSTPEERIFAATLAVNAGNYDEALEHLRAASDESPEHDHALYMLASVLALRDQADEAVPFLLRAIELNPDNRSLAKHDPDLEVLRQFDNVRTVLDAPAPPKSERRKASRRR
ncbi:MAG: tetratricopeptide repeat protein [Acidobacteria bacterium]|nr:MAG: tetratricopeptide repeat protein [Acidobacteriota bacterium]